MIQPGGELERTTISKGLRYISRRVFSLHCTSILKRWNSCSLATLAAALESVLRFKRSRKVSYKCLGVATTSPDSCSPETYSMARDPVKKGSSPKLSKFRPPNGFLTRHIVGASETCETLVFVSSQSRRPMDRSCCLDHVAAWQMGPGRKAAVGPPTERCPRAPEGPSVV